MRLILRVVAALALGVVALLAITVQIYRPASWRSSAPPPGTSVADAARLRADVESFPPSRCRSSPAALGAMEAMVQERLRMLGWSVVAQEVNPLANPHRPTAKPGPPSHNLIATRALAPGGPMFVLGAHLDSVATSPGADDNGSGVAVLLELARLLPPEAAAHTTLVFFNEEEEGLHGSFTYVASLTPSERSRIGAAYVMDMVGGFDDRPHSQAYPKPLSWLAPDRGDFLSVIALREADASVAQLRQDHERVAPNLAIEMFEPPRGLAEKLPDLWRSDHAPFWEAGIPALFFTDTGPFRSDRYHTPADRSDALDYGKMALVATLLLEAAEHPAPVR